MEIQCLSGSHSYHAHEVQVNTPAFDEKNVCGTSDPVITLEESEDRQSVQTLAGMETANGRNVRQIFSDRRKIAPMKYFQKVCKKRLDNFVGTGIKPVHHKMPSPAMRLPDEILDDIFRYTSHRPADLASCSLVCARWHRIVSLHLWESLDPSSHWSMKRLGNVFNSASRRQHRNARGTKQSEVHPTTSNLPLVRAINLGAVGLLPDEPPLKFGGSGGMANGLARWCLRRRWVRVISLAGEALPNLKRLDLSYSAGWLRDDAIFKIVKSCGKTLEELSLANGYLVTDDGIGALARGCKKLRKLDVSHCLLVGDKGVAVLAEEGNRRLRELIMTACNIGDLGVLFLGVFCTELRTLDLEDCFMLTQKSLTVIIAKCIQLEHIKLPCFVYPRFGPAADQNSPHPVLESLLKRPPCSTFKTLGLSMCSGEEIDTHLPRILARFPTIETLEISGSPTVSSIVAPALSHITRLVLASTGQVDDEFAAAVAEHCHELVHLDLSHCRVTAVGAAPLFVKCPKLRFLCLAYNRGLRLFHLYSLLKHKQLASSSLDPEQKRHLAFCLDVRPRLLKIEDVPCPEASRCPMNLVAAPALRTLGLCQIGAITDDCVRILHKIAPNVVDVDLSHCPALVDPRVIYGFVKKARSLKRLNLSCCDRLLGTAGAVRRNGRIVAKVVKVGQEEGLRKWSDEPPKRCGYHHPPIAKLDRHRFCLIESKMTALRAAPIPSLDWYYQWTKLTCLPD
ncbi:hypothetical protein SpCBS45565_g05996 [Spizellomyces sp. 'palustris']|nr:hypothetical protein SpCBS45565_g05996 [Spizellomyces sp. 'palustris']